MNTTYPNLQQWIINYSRGQYDSRDAETQVDAGWWDWFCRDTSLLGRLKRIAPKVLRVAYSKKINPLKTYVLFKNNCPVNGNLYDDFRFCDIDSQEVIYAVVPKTGYTNHKFAEVWGRENDFKEPLVSGTWKDVVEFFTAE
jgi:hypothetical protein